MEENVTLSRRTVRIYAGGLAAASILATVGLAVEFGVAQPAGRWLDWTAWWAATVLVGLLPVPLIERDRPVGWTPVMDFAAAVFFAPFWAASVVLFSRLVLLARAPARRFGTFASDAGGGILSVAAAGTLLHGHEATLPALSFAAAAFLAVRLAVCAAGTLSNLGRMDRPLVQFSTQALHGALGILLAWGCQRVGFAALPPFLLPLLAGHAAFRRWEGTQAAHLTTVRTLISAVDAADPFTRGHAERISRRCLDMARHLGIPAADWEAIEYAALLHDIGRAAIYYDVLLKPGQLNPGERTLMQTHPQIGYDILMNLKFSEAAAQAVLAHHEQPDGKGYPQGLTGAAIPVAARLISVAAAFDAMTQDRPYRRGLSPEAAFQELRSQSGRQFFPEAVEALIHVESSRPALAHGDGEESSGPPPESIDPAERLKKSA